MPGLIFAFLGVFIGGMGVGMLIVNKGFHIHKWSPWTFYQNTDVYPQGKRASDSLPIRREKTYTRVCAKCNLPETTRIEA